MAKTVRIPKRDKVAAEHTWDLAPLFKSDQAWDRAFKKVERQVGDYARFKGKLGRSAKMLAECLNFDRDIDLLADKLGAYAYLRASEDVAHDAAQAMVARFTYLATQLGEAASFIRPEIMAIPKTKMTQFLKAKELAEFRFVLERLLRYRPHTLSEGEERLLAMQGEVAGTAGRVFGQLNDADLSFGSVKDADGRKVELTHSTLRMLMESPKRSVRRTAFHQFYEQYVGHANTLAATLRGSVLQDVYQARARNFPSAREAALFADRVPVAVYDSLIAAVRSRLDVLYHYYDLRKRALKLKAIHAYDMATPLAKEKPVAVPYEEAAETICTALSPLGDEYVAALREGLGPKRWVDRYENQGKRSGAFSYGVYGAPPYILMNYRAESLDSMFTLAHEAGHSMHSYYANRTQPYQYADYTIFVAEVASTFNEQLLTHHLLDGARGKKRKRQLICREIDEIRGTIIRQTMFAEFEHLIHAIAEQGEPLTLERFRQEYRALLEAYFGPRVALDSELELECFRIPHFYSAFYVYKYATGLSAAIALSRQVMGDGAVAREQYLSFLRSGGSDYPLNQLRTAGVDLEQPEPVATAMDRFEELVDALEKLL